MSQTATEDGKPGWRCRLGRHRWHYLTDEEIEALNILETHQRRCQKCGRREWRSEGAAPTGWMPLDEKAISDELLSMRRQFERERKSSDAPFFLVDAEGCTVEHGDAASIREEITRLDPDDQADLQVLAYADGRRSGAPIPAAVFLAAAQS